MTTETWARSATRATARYEASSSAAALPEASR
jgi:hypothetical protein